MHAGKKDGEQEKKNIVADETDDINENFTHKESIF